MINKNRNVKAGLVFLALLLAWSVFIFARSSKTAEESSEESAHIITLVATIIDHEFEKLPPDEKLEYIDSLQFYVRKFAHFSVYAVLGMLGAATAHFFGLHKLTGLVYSVIFAASDEIHQYFVPGRSCELRDFLIDTAGDVFGVAFAAFLCFLLNAAKRKRKSKMRGM